MAAHPLAEAICELAAPGLQPSYIRLLALYEEPAAQCLVLHVRPRRLAAGLEVAAYSGICVDDERSMMRLLRRGALFAAPSTRGGLAQLAADLLAACPIELEYNDQPLGFGLPLALQAHAAAWRSARGDLFDPAEVQASELAPDFAGDVRALGLTFPSPSAECRALASVVVKNAAADYEQTQLVDRGRAGAAQLDSRAEFERRYHQLRDATMARLTAGLEALLRQAARYRGSIEHPLPRAQQAPAAGGEQPGN